MAVTVAGGGGGVLELASERRTVFNELCFTCFAALQSVLISRCLPRSLARWMRRARERLTKQFVVVFVGKWMVLGWEWGRGGGARLEWMTWYACAWSHERFSIWSDAKLA